MEAPVISIADNSNGLQIQSVLRTGIGVLWMIAGLLQFQPLMFTPDFYAWYPPKIMESTIQGVADGQPGFVVTLMHQGSMLWSTHPVLFNVLAASLQLAIGLLMLFGRHSLRTLGLALSVIWGIFVWTFGEAFGHLFGEPSYLIGSPGSAFLYVISSLLLLGMIGVLNEGSARTTLRYVTTLFWFFMAFFQVMPAEGFWQPTALMASFGTAGALPQPRFIGNPIEHFALTIMQYYGLINLVLVLFMLLMAMLTLLDLWNPFTITLAFAWLFWSWWFGQDFGGLFAGAATDLNSIPVIGLWTFSLVVTRRRLVQS
ncbi:hypothetical protein [Alicyclobacillus mengziensis]|uniref:Uncharacterized protein n=1 Tax=Alicyclobacillus mengziensis TaxID=2931921 RepID=A0A9X7Z513_9BACL|nr:hypothetical protein [Alicyclobacillus mengziensis]QSO46474.1 hypothetical protein JZ786_18685 [Alicyclobacillus mengziensis]